MTKPIFFASPAGLRAWLRKNHAHAKELQVGLWKKATNKPTLTWSQVVDEVLCFGWIDGHSKSLGEKSWTIRISPRRPGSNWSAINLRKVKELTRAKRMTPAGLRAYEARTAKKKLAYSYEERRQVKLAPALRRMLRANRKAAAWFEARPPGYRAMVVFWVMSAKKAETRESRMAQLVRSAARGQHVPPVAPRFRKKKTTTSRGRKG